MSYKVDPTTLLFNDSLEWAEANELLTFAERIVLSGHVDLQHPAFRAWVEASGYDERQQLLVYSTVFPQRALLSLTKLLIPRMPGVTLGAKTG